MIEIAQEMSLPLLEEKGWAFRIAYWLELDKTW